MLLVQSRVFTKVHITESDTHDSLLGAHINPAVSIAMLSLRSITPLQCVTYIISRELWKDLNIYDDKMCFI